VTETATCACALLCRHGKFLLARRSPLKKFYPGVWDVPGGHVHVGESLEAALVREVAEEVGVVPTSYRLVETLDEADANKNGPGVYVMFIVTAWDGGEPRLCNDEHTELTWYTSGEAGKLQLAEPVASFLRRVELPRA
jgi:8-oxo-dGTP pyrophosphatase MutT (NUDIX family)